MGGVFGTPIGTGLSRTIRNTRTGPTEKSAEIGRFYTRACRQLLQ
jgi:hypothetical protein